MMWESIYEQKAFLAVRHVECAFGIWYNTYHRRGVEYGITCFAPLMPALETGSVPVWKKNQAMSQVCARLQAADPVSAVTDWLGV